jgi:hypothetical protein
LDKEQCPLPDVTVEEVYLVLAIIMQLGHEQKYILKDYWYTHDSFYMAFCGNIIKHDSLS